MENPLLATDPWADWAAQDQEHYEPPSYAILHHPGLFPPGRLLHLFVCFNAHIHLSSPLPYFLTIDSFKSRGGHTAAIHHGTFAMEGETPLRVVLKTYALEDINLLIHEFDVYAAIAHLAVIVPTLHAVVKPRYDPWGGLILENAGTVLSEYEICWDDLGLTHQEKILLYNTLRQLHSAGVVHGDWTSTDPQAKDGDTSSSAFIRLKRKAAYRACAVSGKPMPTTEEVESAPGYAPAYQLSLALDSVSLDGCPWPRHCGCTTETHGQEAAWELRWYWARRRRGCDHGRPSGAALEPAPTQLKDVSAADVDLCARSGSTTSQLRLAAAFAESGEPNSPEFEGFPGSWSGEPPPQLTFRALHRRPTQAQEADALAHLAAQDDEDAADLDGLAYARSALRGMGGSQSQPRSSGRSSNPETNIEPYGQTQNIE
ncbi:hypothetical protein B0H10DRAFT_2440158 [Mycena sp. CBHHK59/15]|nr:hypothetical protein B0H10DRAFT_2440158 [Mycena sp. CBHHK59/15]